MVLHKFFLIHFALLYGSTFSRLSTNVATAAAVSSSVGVLGVGAATSSFLELKTRVPVPPSTATLEELQQQLASVNDFIAIESKVESMNMELNTLLTQQAAVAKADAPPALDGVAFDTTSRILKQQIANFEEARDEGVPPMKKFGPEFVSQGTSEHTDEATPSSDSQTLPGPQVCNPNDETLKAVEGQYEEMQKLVATRPRDEQSTTALATTEVGRRGDLKRNCRVLVDGVWTFVCSMAKKGAAAVRGAVVLIPDKNQMVNLAKEVVAEAKDLAILALTTYALFHTISGFILLYGTSTYLAAATTLLTAKLTVPVGVGKTVSVSYVFCWPVMEHIFTLVTLFNYAVLSRLGLISGSLLNPFRAIARSIHIVFKATADLFSRVTDAFFKNNMRREVTADESGLTIPVELRESTADAGNISVDGEVAMRKSIEDQTRLVARLIRMKEKKDALDEKINTTRSQITAYKSEMIQVAAEVNRLMDFAGAASLANQNLQAASGAEDAANVVMGTEFKNAALRKKEELEGQIQRLNVA